MTPGGEIYRSANRHIQSAIDGLGELSNRGENYAFAAMICAAAAALTHIWAVDKGGTDYEVMSGSSLVLAIGFGYAAHRERQKEQEKRFNRRQFSQSIDFSEYTYTDPDTSESFTSPFPVFVTGLAFEQLGVGQVIGAVGAIGDYPGKPIVSIEDPKSPNGKVELSGTGNECFWLPLEPEMIEGLADPEADQLIVSAYDYVRALELKP